MVLFTSFVNLGVDSSDDSSVLATSLDSEGYTQDVDIDDDASIVGEMSNAKIEIPAVGCGGSNCDTDDELDTPKERNVRKVVIKVVGMYVKEPKQVISRKMVIKAAVTYIKEPEQVISRQLKLVMHLQLEEVMLQRLRLVKTKEKEVTKRILGQ